MEEEKDRILLSTLGVKSANPEDIKRDVLEKATRNDSGTVTEAEGSAKEERSDLPENVDPLFSAKAELHQKLRAVQFEIDAVASTIELSSNVENNEECRDAGEDGEGQGNAKGDEASRSVENQKVIFSLVKEERKSKRKVKEDKKYNKSTGKRQKKVSFDDDADFDAVLDAAFAGFVETEHHIRTGCGSVSVIVYEEQEKPALITYPDLALNYMSCFQGLFFCPEAASLLLSRITFSANLQF